MQSAEDDMPIGSDATVTAVSAVSAVSANGKTFVWADCSEGDIHKRVFTKQQAVDDALRHSMKICQAIRSPNDSDDATSSAPVSAEERCGREFVEWMEEIGAFYQPVIPEILGPQLTVKQKDKLHESRQNFEVLIGVAGRTGAGKSTILNMLLEIPELLPSSNSEAATSCACRVSWNDDDAPDRKFRAEVVFRSREDVAQELHDIWKKREEFKRLNEKDIEDPDEEFDRLEEAAELQSAIAEGFNKITAVWGLDEEAAHDMSAESVFESNADVLQLLGTTKTIYSEEAEKFAEHVKPYLDSSENVQGFRAWPLITEVRLFVPAPFLKSGVVLVDLPGL